MGSFRVAVALAVLASGCSGPCGRAPVRPAASGADGGEPASAPAGELATQVDAAVARGLSYLVARQQEDGAWRSETYGSFRDGPSLTPVVLKALAFSPPVPGAPEAAARAAAYLRTLPGPDGKLPYLAYPVYTLSLTIVALTRVPGPENAALSKRLVEELRAHQLVEANGWPPDDVSHGGWGYWSAIPTRPPPGTPVEELLSSNLPSTMAAVGALAVAGVSIDDPAMVAAKRFVERCQNLAADPARADPAWDDGGFFFTPANELQNKAMGGTDRNGVARFRSYGSMTAEGVRALLRLGYAPDHPRVRAAAGWLQGRFSATSPPGDYPELREVQRESVYFYWAWSSAHALRALGVLDVGPPDARVRWAEALSRELLSRQGADGAWSNRFTDMREDDPLVATPLALAALGNARLVLAAPPRGP